MFYLKSNTRPDISFAFHQCDWFTHNTKASYEIDVKRICWYLQGTKDKVLVLNIYKKMVVDFYADIDFSRLCGHENPQDPIFDGSKNGFVVIFEFFPLLSVSKLQTEVALYTLHSEYVSLCHSVRESIPLKSFIK